MNLQLNSACLRNFEIRLEDTGAMLILIIEDEPRMLELLSKGLYESGFTVMTASDGEIGLATAMAHELDADRAGHRAAQR